MSLSKIRIRHMLEEKVKGAKLIHKLTENPNKLLGTILVGNNIVNIAASAMATSLAISIYGDKGVSISTVVMTILMLIFGEITPKSYAAQNSEKVAIKVSKSIYALMFILNPITKAINFITAILLRLIGGKPDSVKLLITEEELKTMINVGHEEGILEIEERQMIQNVFEFSDILVKDVMIPRTDVYFINHDATYNEVIELFRREQFSRIPVYEGSLDNIIGILNVKNLLFMDEPSEFNMAQVLIKPHFTYEFKRTRELFEEMKIKKTKLAIVLDEYGGTSGIITIEDIVEEIFGDLEDEYDNDEVKIKVIKEDEYIVDGRTRIDEINDSLGINIESENFGTIGGYIVGEFGYLPEIKQTLESNNIKFEIVEIEKNSIKKLKILT